MSKCLHAWVSFPRKNNSKLKPQKVLSNEGICDLFTEVQFLVNESHIHKVPKNNGLIFRMGEVSEL